MLNHTSSNLNLSYQNPIEQVRKLLRFQPLAEIVPDDLEERLQCLSTRLRGFFKRQHRPLGFDPFTKEMKLAVNGYIASARSSLGRLGFTLPAYERPVEV